ncbi:dihydrofolate reductase family protein [Cyanobium sp. ATX 6A2]|uniref:dihydrofolate reductase family protein n=1 Tax=Cyanobium sp. ATX 6A2 TaxID=2823700 RepID=UPI0020CD3A1C|nr:dihydrofolate reductase family protein [Cyanobium sp. ATX 6A2]
MLAVSLDGRLAPPAGGAAQLGGAGDRRALEEALAWADAALLGAETLRRHGSTCLIHAPDLLAARGGQGRSAQPTALVLSRSGHIPPGLPFWRQPLQRWWLQPAGRPSEHDQPAHPEPGPRPRMLPGCDRVLAFSSWVQLRSALAAEGLRRLVLLGGADLAGQLLAAEQVDELQLTLCPLLLGGPHSWLPPSLGLRLSHWQLLEQRPLGGDELLLRYLRRPVPVP